MTQVEYISKKRDHDITIKGAKRIVVDNEVVPVQGLRAQFRNYKFITHSGSDIEKALDDLLTGPRGRFWSRKFQKKPSDRVLKKFDETAKRIQAAKEAVVAEMAEKTKPEDQKAMEDFDKFLKRMKDNAPKVVTGMRTVGK